MFPTDPHPDVGTGEKVHMPSFGGRPGAGAFATYDMKTGETNEAGSFVKKVPVEKNAAMGLQGTAQVDSENGVELEQREEGEKEESAGETLRS
jgi:hypothetical protein